MDVPMENSAMMAEPSAALADRDATNKAEYSKPQGMSAHATPNTTGARCPSEAITGRAFRQID
jgi:hypothetical protein